MSIIGDVIQAAIRTGIWLWEAADNSDTFLKAVAAGYKPSIVDKDFNTDCNATRFAWDASFQCNIAEYSGYKRFIASKKDPQYLPNFLAWSAMGQRPYWRRTWIV